MSEELIIRHCSPTLAGIKTASLFSCSYESKKGLCEEISRLNQRLVMKGLHILPLKFMNKKVLVYVYRPKKLKLDLLDADAQLILESYDYPCNQPERCIQKLVERLQTSDNFPHEIGLFLGYPPKDVEGFIKNEAKSCKCCGYWKVYSDEVKAKKLFIKYELCTQDYIRQLKKGNNIERLTVSL